MSPHYLTFINNGANIGIFLESVSTFFIRAKNRVSMSFYVKKNLTFIVLNQVHLLYNFLHFTP